MDTKVLIVGGSLSGLCASLFCARLGIDHLLVERHPGTAIHPRINGINAYSMELFDGLGVGDQIRAMGRTGDRLGAFFAADSLASPHYLPFGGPEDEDVVPASLSPTGMCACDQDVVEPILRDRARQLGAELRFGVELVAFEQSANQVVATLRDVATGAERAVTAAYMLAADGPRSRIRERLDVDMHGPGLLSHALSIVFRADLEPALRGRLVYAVFGDFGTFVRRGGERWQLVVPFDPTATELATELTQQRGVELIRLATGLPDVEADILTVTPLEIRAQVADRFTHHRVFLVGDAAHPAPPAGGLGGNMCIQDAHNLVWKLGAVLHGTAGPGLLDTYDIERRPIADVMMACQLADVAPDNEAAHDWDYATVVFGHHYSSSAVISAYDAPREAVLDPRFPSGRAGSRAPHLVVERHGHRSSTIDLTGHRFVLLAGQDGEEWLPIAARIAARVDVEIESYLLGRDLVDVEQQWPVAYAASSGDAVLIRPDGVIAWHSRGNAPSEHALGVVVDRIMSRTPS